MNLVKYITPKNLLSEREKFFASKTYNPVFEYERNENEVAKWLQNFPIYKKLVEALDSENSEQIVKEACLVFNTNMNQTLLNLAKNYTSKTPEKLLHQKIEDVVLAFEKIFKELGFFEYKVDLVDQHGFNFHPHSSSKKIVISKHAGLDFFSIDGEVKHEIAHIIRYENGVHNNIKRSRDYLPTEEGLATYVQDYHSTDGEKSLFQHAAEYTVTEVALKGSLRDMVNYLVDLGFNEDLAFKRASRHKFGFRDTSKAGDIMKPSMYFYHQQKVRELSAQEKYRLFVGKISIDDLPKHPIYSGRVSFEKLQEIYGF